MIICDRCGQPSQNTICDGCLLRAVRMPQQVQLLMEEEQANRARLSMLTTTVVPPVLYEEPE